MIDTKVIQNNFNKENFDEPEQKIVHTCDYCHSELELTPEDTHIGWLGAAYVTCPCCGEESLVDELEGITLTKDNIKFPLHFKRCNNTMKDVHNVDNESIEKEICRGIEYLAEHQDEYVWFTSYGDLWMMVDRLSDDEEYYIVVTKDFYNSYIPFGEDDYESMGSTW